jgi:S1-C subfamily serine protease
MYEIAWRAPARGEELIVAGHPGGKFTVAKIAAGARRSITSGGSVSSDFIIITPRPSELGPGAHGGPVLDGSGKLIGLFSWAGSNFLNFLGTPPHSGVELLGAGLGACRQNLETLWKS